MTQFWHYSIFTEREENVKVDIFHAYMALLRQTRPSLSLSLDPDAMEQEEGTISMLKQQVCIRDSPVCITLDLFFYLLSPTPTLITPHFLCYILLDMYMYNIDRLYVYW